MATIAQIKDVLTQENLAKNVAELWNTFRNQRQGWESEKDEIREYVFATDTTTTSNKSSGWNNKTTMPKLCQIRDNLHAHYMSAAFPNDAWMRWEGYTQEDDVQEKKEAIQAYMQNKVRMSNFVATASKMILDYIDFGFAVGTSAWCNESKVDPATGEIIPGYVGAKAMRISPLDIVFDPTAPDFDSTWKIVRSMRRLSELRMEAEANPDKAFWLDHINAAQTRRNDVGGWHADDWRKAKGFSMDGFGDLRTYYGSGYVEILEFYGTMSDPDTNVIYDDHVITVIDRQTVVRNVPIPAWKRNGYFVATSWRQRPDNLYGMGPLDNLVGMQYRIDHLENLKADKTDINTAPPLKVIGQVGEFEWKPYEQIEISEGGDVIPLFIPDTTQVIDSEIMFLLNLMEEFAGAPRQAMGIRTPGEKTAFEVSTLDNNASRTFQQKSDQFIREIVEPLLNNMLMESTRRLDGAEIVRVLDDDFGYAQFLTITKEDITASGKLRPIGARHFSARAQLLQNISQTSQTPLWDKISPHVGNKALARLWEDILQLDRFEIVSENAAIVDEAETQRMAQGAQDTLAEESMVDVGGEIGEEL